MTEEARLHFERAAECLEDAKILLDNERPAAAVARSYYAMFHAATAVLSVKSVKRSSHRGILSAFGEFLVKPGLLEQRMHQSLREAFELRRQTDYEPIVEIDSRQATETLEHAIEFIDACKKLTA